MSKVIDLNGLAQFHSDLIKSEFSETTSDKVVPSEKLVKDSLDTKADVSDLPKNSLVVYVDQVNGSDDNDGLTESTPIKELTYVNKAVSKWVPKSIEIVIMSDITYDTLTSISFWWTNIRVYAYGCSSAYTTDYSKNKKLTNVNLCIYTGRPAIYNIDFESSLYTSTKGGVTLEGNTGFNFNMCRFTNTNSSVKGVGINGLRTYGLYFQNCIFTNLLYPLYFSFTKASLHNTTFDNCSKFYLYKDSVLNNVPTENLSMVTDGTYSQNAICYLSDGTQYINGVRSLGKNDITDIDASLKMLGYTLPESLRGMNYIDSDGVFHQNIVRVDVGSVASSNWTYGDAYKWFYYKPGDVKIVSSKDTIANIYCVGYTPNSYNSTYNDLTLDMKVGTTTAGSIFFRNLSYTDVDSFLSAMSGVYVYYELATEITKKVDGNEMASSSEEWTFTLLDGTIVTKNVLCK